jgi:hypothetical protein
MNKEQASNNRLMSPRSINDFLNYQEDAVVSRELIRKATGTVTLFAFDKNQGLSEHTAPYDGQKLLFPRENPSTLSV